MYQPIYLIVSFICIKINPSIRKGAETTYTMVGRDKEKYECTIPIVEREEKEGDAQYKGLTPLGLMEKIFVGRSTTLCFIKIILSKNTYNFLIIR